MGCFRACFGSKDRKRAAQRKHTVDSPDQSYARQKPPQSPAFSQLEISTKPTTSLIPEVGNNVEEKPSSSPARKVTFSQLEISTNPLTSLIPEVGNNVEEKPSSSPARKVTFNTNVKIYETVSVQESTDLSPETHKDIEQKDDSPEKSSVTCSLSENDSVALSKSFPPYHRYHNCRDSDDETEEYESDDVDSNDEDDTLDDLADDCDYDESEESIIIKTVSMESKTGVSSASSVREEVGYNPDIHTLPEHLTKDGSIQHVRDRSGYVHPVLNPVENLTQWKVLRTKGFMPSKPQKENIVAREETPYSSFSAEPTFKHSSPALKSKPDESKNQSQDIAVDSSLSNWLESSKSTPSNKLSDSTGTKTVTSERSFTPESKSWLSIEERPILGALTMEELKKFSTSSSPRKSPSRSPDDMAIIGTVGTYWSHSESTKDSGSSTSFKGIPNTTSKYREDKRVNWNSTPFETRLERALKGHS